MPLQSLTVVTVFHDLNTKTKVILTSLGLQDFLRNSNVPERFKNPAKKSIKPFQLFLIENKVFWFEVHQHSECFWWKSFWYKLWPLWHIRVDFPNVIKDWDTISEWWSFLAWGTLSTQGIVILSGVVYCCCWRWRHKSCPHPKFENRHRYWPNFF